MNIKLTKATKVVLVPFDEIPLSNLLPQEHLERLGRLFGFRNVEIAKTAGQVGIVFEHGVFDTELHSRAIDKLEISERKIVLTVEGTSENADELLAELEAHLLDLSNAEGEQLLHPILESHESEIVAQLDFSVEDLLSPTYFDFVRNTVQQEANSDIASATIQPVTLQFRVDYLLKDESIQEQRISLSPKVFSLEPRRGSLLADRIYYSKAPFDTDTHLRLLKELETRFA
jgi:hypothetical protein